MKLANLFKKVSIMALIFSILLIPKSVTAAPTHQWEYYKTRYYNASEICTSHKNCCIRNYIKEDTYWCKLCDLTYLQSNTVSSVHVPTD